MNWLHILHAILSLIFVIGLLLLCLWLFKYLETKGFQNKIFKTVNNKQKIHIVEIRKIDTKNSIAIIKCQQKLYTILLSSHGNLILSEDTEISGNE